MFYSTRQIEGKIYVVDPWGVPIQFDLATELIKMLTSYIASIPSADMKYWAEKVHHMNQSGLMPGDKI